MTGLAIRRAKAGDEDLILTLLYELAEYEKLTHTFRITHDMVKRDFFGARPAIRCDLAFVGFDPVGLATWYWTYTTFGAARGAYLEDLYVRESMRGNGFGRALLAHLAKQTLAEGGVRVEWSVLDWNKPSIDFYEGIGARAVRGWSVYRLADDPLKTLAGSVA